MSKLNLYHENGLDGDSRVFTTKAT